jgi:hypothetical protein
MTSALRRIARRCAPDAAQKSRIVAHSDAASAASQMAETLGMVIPARRSTKQNK